MSRFAIRFPFFILMICLIVSLVGSVVVGRMPVDLFPEVRIPVVVVATFYNGMPPEQIESNITNPFERFFTLGSGIDHIESRSLTGVSLIKVYFQPGTDPDAAVTNISNLAMAQLRRLPPGTFPPVVLKFDASSLPVCLVTLKGDGLDEAKLHDLGQFDIRNQLAGVPGASIPQPFGGKYRQIQVYVDPVKMQAYQLSPMDVVRSINSANAILPAGDVRIGPRDFNIYTNAQFPAVADIDQLPLKSVGNGQLLVSDIGHAKDDAALQTGVVRIDGQRSVYLPILKQGGDSNTISIVSGARQRLKTLLNMPATLKANVVFDQSVFVKTAIANLGKEGAIGLILTALMILAFLGNFRATIAVLLSIPLSVLAAFLVLNMMGETVNAMVLGGFALAFSRLIDNSVVVLENIFRHMEEGKSPQEAAEIGGREVALPVLAATFTTAIVFFPVVFLYGVSRFLFVPLALSVVLSLFASYVVAMTVVPLFCAKFLKGTHAAQQPKGWFAHFVHRFNHHYGRLLRAYDNRIVTALQRPRRTLYILGGLIATSLLLVPFIGRSFFPRTDPGQFLINVKAPSGTRIENTEQLIARAEQEIRSTVPARDLGTMVANIGVTPDFSAIYTSNSGQNTAFIQVGLKEGHKKSSLEYMNMVRARLRERVPELTVYFQTGGLVDSVVNLGLPAPIDLQISGTNMKSAYETAATLKRTLDQQSDVADTLIPQDLDYPGLRLNVNRAMAGRLGISSSEVIDNVITTLSSNGMIAPSYWVDPKNGNNYLLTVQVPDSKIASLDDFRQIPIRAPSQTTATTLSSVADIEQIATPTEVDHYQLARTIDLYVSPSGDNLAGLANHIEKILQRTNVPGGLRVTMRGSVEGMNKSFQSFGLGLLLATILVYLILMAQFASFKDPLIILLAVPPGIMGVILILLLTHTTLNVMSLMGVIMMTGIVTSNSILIVEFTRSLIHSGKPLDEAVAMACRVRLRPILMTSLATVLGMIPMALALESGSELYAPLARAVIGGLLASLVMTIFLVPAAYLLAYHQRENSQEAVNAQ